MTPSPTPHRLGSKPSLDAVRAPYLDQLFRSWQRCLEDYHLKPSEASEPALVATHDLQQRLQQHSDVIACAHDEMEALFQLLSDAKCAVVLTDSDGVILHMVTSTEFAQQGHPLGLRIGGAWNERAAGTNGMGTCLATQRPIVVHREDHFFNRLSQFTCTAVPMIDPLGDMVGVLDITSLSPLMQPTQLKLLELTVQLIENRLLACRYKDCYMVRFHTQSERLFTQFEGRLAVNETGQVLAANRQAWKALGFQSLATMRHQRLEDIFQSSLPSMLQSSAEAHFHPVQRSQTGPQSLFHVVAQQPFRAKTKQQMTPQWASEGASLSPAYCIQDTRLIGQLSTACRVMSLKTPLLLSGETGSGKEVFAKTVHSRSPCAQGPFVAINCASLPANLIEAELFGYRAGAFTGAQVGGRQGKILQAHQGTLFLDEIADMPLDLQARLLRVLDEKQVHPLGTDKKFAVEFQLISASHQHLPDLVRQHRFREDLYYRLLGIELRLSPLREREDKRALIHHIMQAEGHESAQLSLEAEQTLMRYPWPGNLRELRHVMRSAAALADGHLITLEHLTCLTERMAQLQWADMSTPPSTATKQPLSENGWTQEKTSAGVTPDPLSHLSQERLIERQTLLRTIETQHWNLSRVAQIMGISRNTLYRKIRKLRINLKGSKR